MPKRGAKPADPEPEAPPEEPPVDLDLSSDEEVADDEAESDSEDPVVSEDGASSIESDEEELQDAIADYMKAAAEERPADARGDDGEAGPSGEDHLGPPESLDPGSDSSEDERPNRNTVGAVPLEWYKDEEHIGYDVEGRKLLRKQRGDKLDALLARNDSRSALRTIYDEYNDEEIRLTREELEMVMRIRKGQFPHVSVNPYEPYVDWFTSEVEPVPISDRPPAKARFVPSKWEEKKIVKIVRAIRKGWLKTDKQRRQAQQQPVYMLWADDAPSTDKTGSGLTYIPAAKPKLPGHEESYNPPKEYLPTEEEVAGYQLLDEEDRPKFVPRAFDSLRQVPMYADFIKERFERCLDLYLCPRVRKKRMFIDPQSLIPKLPKPSELQPFPTALAVRYLGHKGKVRSIAPHPSGQWLASGSDDGSMRLWEVRTGRCMRVWQLGAPVHSVSWCPNPQLQLLAAAVESRVVLLPSGLGGESVDAAAAQALRAASSSGQPAGDKAPVATWQAREDGGLEVVQAHPVRYVTWHARGDYFASVAPTGATQSVLVHQLSKGASQNPFRKNRGRVVRVAFHPRQPFFFVATQNHVRVYNLAKQALAKKLVGGSGAITCLAVHPSGDHIIVGSEDKRLAWYDLDLSATPYKALRYHQYAVRGAAFHPGGYPLFASSSDDGTCQVFHGMVYSDLMTNPLIVPVKILRGHEVVDHGGVLDCAWHPHQPWVFTAGADGAACLYCN